MDKETEYEKDLGEIKPCSIHSSNSKLSGYATCCSNHTNELAILPNNPTVIQNFMKVFDPRLFAESVALLSLLNKILSKGSMPLVEAITNAFLRCSKVSFVYFVAWYVWKYIIAEPISNANKGVNNVWEQVKIASAAPKKKRIAIIGTGISGIQAIKTCLAESGVEPVCFEADNDIGGFWRYKESTSVPSIYKSTHIDTDRDLAGYMDIPWNPNTQLTIRNDKMIKYLRDNIEILGLNKYIRFNHRVELVSPHEKNEINGWNWKISFLNDKNERTEEVFDGVMVATGRHGGGAYLPPFPGLETTKVTWMHSSQFKDPDFHNLRGKTVVVVGVGNSGIDIVTEVSPIAGKCFLVSRSGVWVTKLPHGDWAFSEGVGDRLTMSLFLSLPWMVQTELFERFGLFFQSDQQRDQEILNKHGLKPKHRFWQQHTIMTGLNGRATLHDELEAGRIIVKKGIDRMTENGVIFVDDDGNETKVDVVVFATGYKQQASFVDQKVVDLRFHRKGNDVMLYKYIFPTSGYDNIGFINLAQTITFMSSDLQTRAFMEVFMKRLKLPSKEIMEKEIQDVRRTLNAQYIDRSQLRVQGGANYLYYEDLAEFLGCNPTIWRILTQRPSAIWHSFFVTWCSLQYRLVGPGRLEIAERWIEERFQTRYYSATYPNGKKKKAPNDRDGLIGTLRRIQGVAVLYILRLVCIMQGHNMGGRIQDFLEANLKYAKEDMESRGIYHAIDEKDGAEPSDFSKYNGKISVWGKQ